MTQPPGQTIFASGTFTLNMPPKHLLTPQCWAAWKRFRPLLTQCGWPALPIARIHPDGSVSVDQPSPNFEKTSMMVGCMEDGSLIAAVMCGFRFAQKMHVNMEDPTSLARLKNMIAHVFHGEILKPETRCELVRID